MIPIRYELYSGEASESGGEKYILFGIDSEGVVGIFLRSNRLYEIVKTLNTVHLINHNYYNFTYTTYINNIDYVLIYEFINISELIEQFPEEFI